MCIAPTQHTDILWYSHHHCKTISYEPFTIHIGNSSEHSERTITRLLQM